MRLNQYNERLNMFLDPTNKDNDKNKQKSKVNKEKEKNKQKSKANKEK